MADLLPTEEGSEAIEPSVPGISVAPLPRQFALNAQRNVVPAIRSAQDCLLHGAPAIIDSQGLAERLLRTAQPECTGVGNPLLDQDRASTLQACAAGGQVVAVLNGLASTAE